MFSNSLYYRLKPFIPRKVQIEIRRKIALRKRAKYSHIWPIDESAGKPPEGWQGWPDGKKFALILTHDVETAEGVKKCRQLAELEESLGFKSCFNFVAEDYDVPNELIDFLKARGFEVGVHGLHHHGNLFGSRKKFREQVPRINHFIEKWGAKGFRTPSLYHNLDWIAELNIEYDSSTFDTDPFEPQPDGAGTVFPFWVPATRNPLPEFDSSEPGTRNSKPETFLRNGFVELPYTLPQDFTLFVLMKEKNIDIWKEKIDWIANHGGMALLITHPDYMHLDNGGSRASEYPLQYYRELLDYIQVKYSGRYWHVLPGETASFWEGRCLTGKATLKPLRAKLRVCMLSYSFYESDGRVRRYAETLSKHGDHVEVIALKRDGQKDCDTINQVDLFRIQKRVRDERGKFSHLYRIMKFLIKSGVFLTGRHLKDPYQLIHVHNVPDFLVFATLFPKLFGAKIILDIHDVLPELYTTKFGESQNGGLFRVLAFLEKISGKFADHVIVANHIWEKKLISRSIDRAKCSAILNYPDQTVFFKRPRRKNDGRFIMIYPGTLVPHQGIDIAIRAFSSIKDEAPETELHIYGDGSIKGELKTLAFSLGLDGRVIFNAPLPIEQIAEIMANSDLGLEPKRNDPFSDEALSTKVLEFMALGVPVIISRTKIDEYYFNDSLVRFFNPGDPEDLANAMREMARNRDVREALAANASQFVQDFSWEKRKHEYLDLVDRLVNSK